MAKVDEFKIVFPNEGVSVRAARLPGINERIFDYWVSCLPIAPSVWSPAFIAGHVCYSHYLKMSKPFPWQITDIYETSDWNVYLNEAPQGICTLFNGQGYNGEIICKWGPEVTEPMCYPAFAKVVDEDLGDVLLGRQARGSHRQLRALIGKLRT